MFSAIMPRYGPDVPGMMYAAIFILLLYANYSLLEPYVVMFINSALLSTALRPTKRKCLKILSYLSGGVATLESIFERDPTRKPDGTPHAFLIILF